MNSEDKCRRYLRFKEGERDYSLAFHASNEKIPRHTLTQETNKELNLVGLYFVRRSLGSPTVVEQSIKSSTLPLNYFSN